MRFAFIAKHEDRWPIAAQCRVLNVTPGGFAGWRKRRRSGVVSRRQQSDFRLLIHIRVAHKQKHSVYGSPRVHRLLRGEGHCVSRKRVARIMRENGLRGKNKGRRKPCTTQSNHGLPVAENLLNRRFSPQEIGGIDRVWCADITYLPTTMSSLYLAVVLDAFSRRIVGWQISHTMEAKIVVDALDKAMETRGEVESIDGQRLFHSDRGSQYASRVFSKKVTQHGFTQSMSRRANCWDNALVESFFASFKSELVEQLPGQKFDNLTDAHRLIADYIDNFYNQTRLHSTLDYTSPVAFEMACRLEELSSN